MPVDTYHKSSKTNIENCAFHKIGSHNLDSIPTTTRYNKRFRVPGTGNTRNLIPIMPRSMLWDSLFKTRVVSSL